MQNVSLIYNTNNKPHYIIIKDLMLKADEVWLATAFLKSSGLKILNPELKKYISSRKPIKIICGKHFGLTEPAALEELHAIFLNKESSFFYMDRGEIKTSVFHPKIFAFKIENEFHLISGSANITQGGLENNEEFSIYVKCGIDDEVYKETMKYFDQICNNDHAELVTELLIHRYKQFYKEQALLRKAQKVVPEKSSASYQFDYEKLSLRLKDFDWKDFVAEAKERELDYQLAKQLLNEIVDTNVSQGRFEEIIDELVGKAGQWGLWRSGSLLRLRFKVYKHKKEFKALVKYIREEKDKAAGQVFFGAKPLVAKIKGARMNYVTEIMMTYDYLRFANLNSNPITVLKNEAGVYFKAHSDSYNAEDYEGYCKIIAEICQKLGFKNMLEADSFFNEIYWKIK